MIARFGFASILGVLSVVALSGCGDSESDNKFGGGQGGQGGGSARGGSGGLIITGGTSSGGTSSGGTSGSGSCSPALTGIVRDFKAFQGGQGHPDFETFLGQGDKGLVQPDLGMDHKPVFAHTGDWQGTTGGCNRDGQNNVRCVTNPDSFSQWYRNTSGVNEPIEHTITLTAGANGIATYDNSNFYPIEGQAFGNEGRSHNYHFTFELHMTFKYRGGESFAFTGDDDLWVFVNNRLAIDLGGLHSAQSDTLNLDARAAELGIQVGGEYPLDFFHAERHTNESNFKIQSTLNFTNCKPIVY